MVNCTSYHKTDEVEEHATKAFLINAHAVKVMAKCCKAGQALWAGAPMAHAGVSSRQSGAWPSG